MRAQKRPVGRAWRWTKRIVLALLGTTAFVIAVALGLLHTDWGRAQVKDQIVKSLHDTFPGGVRIGKLSGSVFGTLVVDEVELDATDHKPLVTVKQLRIELALLPLLGKTARIEKLVADEVIVDARRHLPPAPPPPPAGEPTAWSVEMPWLRVQSAHVAIETERGRETIEGVDLKAALYLPAHAPLAAWVEGLARWRGKDVSLVAAIQRRQDATIDVPFASVTLGDAHVVASGVRITDAPAIAGSVALRAPAALVKTVANVELPGDVALIATAASSGDIRLAGSVGDNDVLVVGNADLARRSARALVSATVPDVARVSEDKVHGAGTVVATLAADEQHVSGLVSIVGEAEGQTGSALAVLDATRERARFIVMANARKDRMRSAAAVSGVLAKTGEQWNLVESQLVADTRDPAPIRGAIEARLTASGPVYPARDVAVAGTITAKRIVHPSATVSGASARVAARIENDVATGTLEVAAGGIRKGTFAIPSATIAARGSRSKDGVITLALARHRVRTADGGIWSGSGGRVTITGDQIVLADLHTGTGASHVIASATMARHDDSLAAKVSARDVSLAMIDPQLAGEVAADLDVSRRGGMWSGTAKVDAKQVTLPKRPPFDGTLAIEIDKRRVTAHATAQNPKIGGATFDLDLVAPADITNRVAWQHVKRSAIKNLRVAFSKIDAAQLGGSGNLDGELAISGGDAHGNVAMRGLETSAGSIDSELVISRSPDGSIAAHGSARLAGLEPVTVDASLVLPEHPFDPGAWQQLGRGALRGATIEAPHLAFDPALAKRFGITTTAKGTLAAKFTLGPAARTGDFVVDVHELTGIQLGKPVEIHVAGGHDDQGIHATASARADTLVVDITGKTALTLDGIIAGHAKTTPIDVTVDVPKVAARDVALLLHRSDVLGGVLSGTVTLGGTIEAPKAHAQLAAEKLAVAAGLSRKPPMLEKLELDARWQDGHAELELTGHEGVDRVIKISARGRPDSFATIVATIEAGNFDIAPIAAFAPGQLAGARGILGGVVKITGLDRTTGEAKGVLRITEGRLPLADQLGTLRGATIDITIKKQEIVAVLDGKIGPGTVKGKVTARLLSGAPTAAELELHVRKISTIGTKKPRISADITGWLAATHNGRWTGKLVVDNADVYVPPEAGNQLLGLGAPDDLIFVDAKTPPPKLGRRPPRNPWLVTDVDLRTTKVKIEDEDFTFEGYAGGALKLSVGDGVGLDGSISTERATVDVVGRRYRLDHGVLDFDGTFDPELDIELMHDFHQQLTLTVDISGRASAPDVRLSGDPATYNQSQLLAILMGGDPGEAGQGAIAGGASAVFSARVAKRLTKQLPIKLDTINYEAQTASSSGAIRVGQRLSDRLYLTGRFRVSPRPDENPAEGVLEYELSQSWVIEGTGGPNANFGDIMWRHSW